MVSSSHPQGEKETMERGQGTCPRVGFAGRAPVSRFPKLVSGERGSVALYLLKLLIPFVILGFIISQAGPIVWNQIYTRIMASDVCDYALQIYRENNGNMEKVNVKVREMVVGRGGRLVGDVVVVSDASGRPRALFLRVRRITSTLLFRRISYLAPYTEARAEVMKEIQ